MGSKTSNATTSTDRVAAICARLGGLRPDPSVDDGTWSTWLQFFDGMGTTGAADLCPECGGWMAERKGKYGLFRGCSNYPDCRHTESV